VKFETICKQGKFIWDLSHYYGKNEILFDKGSKFCIAGYKALKNTGDHQFYPEET
jgi:hypothetical protein